MSLYRFTAKDENGKLVKSTFTAGSVNEFYDYLKEQKLYCTDVREYSGSAAEIRSGYKLKMKELIIFCRKMGTMLKSGLSMNGALEILYETAETTKQKGLFLSLYENVQMGYTLSSALKNQHGSFPPFLINMVESGEESGNIDNIMLKLCDHYERENKIRHKIKSATAYPLILLCVSIGVIILLFAFVLPNLISLFQNAEVPAITRFIMSISDFMVNYWYVLVIIAVAVILFFAYAKRITGVKTFMDKVKLKLPIVGKMNRIVYSSRFARSMAILYSSGIPLISGIRLSSNILGNNNISNLFGGVTQSIALGDSLSSSIERIHVFDPLLPSMIKVGEESGQLDSVLETIADFYDVESENAINRTITILEPVMLVILAVIITFVIVGVMLPIYNSYSSLL